MAIDAAKTSYGYAITCTGGTAAASVVEKKEVSVSIVGILMTGAATTDIVTVTDWDGNLIFKGVAQNTGGSASMNICRPIRVNGLRVGVAGATTGWVTIFTE